MNIIKKYTFTLTNNSSKYINKKLKYGVFKYACTSVHLSVCLFICILISSCAQVVAPGGGALDKTPARVVKYVPDSASLNFKSKSIVFVFDEYIQLKDLNNQLIISPPLEYIPDIDVKNKTLTLTFDKAERLKPNTTYSINLGNALQDIHENTPIDNFKYIFSTGSFIDSLTVQGKVQNSFDHKAEKDILVMLYSDFNDSSVYKRTPDYFGKTKEDGAFKINNIRQGKYKLLALKDANANYKYEGDAESIGFYDTLVDVSEKKNIAIEMFQQPAKKLFLKKWYSSFGKAQFIFNKPVDTVILKPLNHTFDSKDFFVEYSKNRDTLNYWFRNSEKDSLILQLSDGIKIIDTVAFKVIKRDDAVNSKRTPFKFRLLSNPAGSFDLNGVFALVFSNPIDPVLFNNMTGKEIRLMEDTVLYKGHISLFYDLKSLSTITVNMKALNNENSPVITPVKLKENTAYHLFIAPGTFTDIFGLPNDTIKIDFKTREEKQYGSVKLKIDVPEIKMGAYIIQLLDEKENIVRAVSIKKSETLTYIYLIPRKYKLKVIVDENGNGKWDTGNLLQHRQPERTIYNAEPVNIRANWDFELEWKIVNP